MKKSVYDTTYQPLVAGKERTPTFPHQRKKRDKKRKTQKKKMKILKKDGRFSTLQGISGRTRELQNMQAAPARRPSFQRSPCNQQSKKVVNYKDGLLKHYFNVHVMYWISRRKMYLRSAKHICMQSKFFGVDEGRNRLWQCCLQNQNNHIFSDIQRSGLCERPLTRPHVGWFWVFQR